MAVAHKGSISMGLVLIPIGMYRATVDNDIHFNQLEKESKGYTVGVLNIAHPDRSNISFDPIMSIESYGDIDALSAAIINATIKNTVDDYWNAKAKALLKSLKQLQMGVMQFESIMHGIHCRIRMPPV